MLHDIDTVNCLHQIDLEGYDIQGKKSLSFCKQFSGRLLYNSHFLFHISGPVCPRSKQSECLRHSCCVSQGVMETVPPRKLWRTFWELLDHRFTATCHRDKESPTISNVVVGWCNCWCFVWLWHATVKNTGGLVQRYDWSCDECVGIIQHKFDIGSFLFLSNTSRCIYIQMYLLCRWWLLSNVVAHF